MDDAGDSIEEADINVFLIDDHQLIREVIGKLIKKSSGLTLCGEAASADEALEKLPLCQPKPDVALVDLSLGQMNGIPLIRRLSEQFPDLRILVISSHEESRFAPLALAAGAHGYLMKKDGIDLSKAVHQVYNGRIYLSKAMQAWFSSNGNEPEMGLE
ncbi:MAG: response regulator transcription factor [Anaerolineaceae bacterium]|nr:response regulator transcription factor [Anaerolineaceae bacterium]